MDNPFTLNEPLYTVTDIVQEMDDGFDGIRVEPDINVNRKTKLLLDEYGPSLVISRRGWYHSYWCSFDAGNTESYLDNMTYFYYFELCADGKYQYKAAKIPADANLRNMLIKLPHGTDIILHGVGDTKQDVVSCRAMTFQFPDENSDPEYAKQLDLIIPKEAGMPFVRPYPINGGSVKREILVDKIMNQMIW